MTVKYLRQIGIKRNAFKNDAQTAETVTSRSVNCCEKFIQLSSQICHRSDVDNVKKNSVKQQGIRRQRSRFLLVFIFKMDVLTFIWLKRECLLGYSRLTEFWVSSNIAEVNFPPFSVKHPRSLLHQIKDTDNTYLWHETKYLFCILKCFQHTPLLFSSHDDAGIKE